MTPSEIINEYKKRYMQCSMKQAQTTLSIIKHYERKKSDFIEALASVRNMEKRVRMKALWDRLKTDEKIEKKDATSPRKKRQKKKNEREINQDIGLNQKRSPEERKKISELMRKKRGR